MGIWDYYVVRMRMADLGAIKYASEVNDDKTLDDTIQRRILKQRAPQIVSYLQNSDQRFFNSIVVAALNGNPKWFPVKISEDERFEFFKGDEIEDTFGILRFDDTIKTYALDGQHRLFAILQLVNNQADTPPPAGFSDETISVAFVVPPEDMSDKDFKKSYRRLFSALNRHAKQVAKNDIIIMDEDDRFALLTRRLISDLEFFQWSKEEGGQPVIDTNSKTESLSPNSNSLTTIVGLYEMNTRMLWTQEYISKYSSRPHGSEFKKLCQITPTDEELDELYAGLERIWDGLLLTFSEFYEEPVSKRRHGTEGEDSLLFHPIGQKHLLAPIVRRLLDEEEIGLPESAQQVVEVLKPLTYIPWDLQHDLWRDFLIHVNPENGRWIMRSDQRQACLDHAYNILLWLTGCENLDEDGIDDMRAKWASLLLPPGDNDREIKTFDALEELRENILKLK